jgi:hypothetical protein
MRSTWRLQQTDPDYQFDTPLPANAGQTPDDVVDELQSFIGELAPEGLK